MGYVTYGEIANASVPTPATGKTSLFFDTSDEQPKWKNSAATVTRISANDGLYKTIAEGYGHLGTGITAGTFTLFPNSSSHKSAADVVANTFPFIYLQAADYLLTGFTTKLRVKLVAGFNATAPGTITFTAGLFPVTVAGGTGAFIPTLGAVVSGSNGGTIVNPSLSTVNVSTGQADFTIPADGAYALGYTTSATSATNGFVKVQAVLQMRNV